MGLGGVVGGALAEDFGGLVSLQMALTFLLPEPELEELLLLLLPPELHAARARAATDRVTAVDRVFLRMSERLSFEPRSATAVAARGRLFAAGTYRLVARSEQGRN